jgi:hypothetical protein
MTKLAEAISHEEGFGIPGTLPTRNHNPGDLRHSPHSQHTVDAPNAIGNIDNDADGWADLERQLRIFAERKLTLRQCVAIYAPPNENNSAQYLAFVCGYLGLTPDDTVAHALTIQ